MLAGVAREHIELIDLPEVYRLAWVAGELVELGDLYTQEYALSVL